MAPASMKARIKARIDASTILFLGKLTVSTYLYVSGLKVAVRYLWLFFDAAVLIFRTPHHFENDSF